MTSLLPKRSIYQLASALLADGLVTKQKQLKERLPLIPAKFA
jgi:hypothetical protein